MTGRQAGNRSTLPRAGSHVVACKPNFSGLIATTGLMLAVLAVAAPLWLLIGPPADGTRSPVTGVIDMCQEGVRRGSLAAIGFVAAGTLLSWGVAVCATAVTLGARSALLAAQRGRLLEANSREVEVFAGDRPVAVRIIPSESAGAFTTGLLRPKIYLGATAMNELKHDELEAVVLHELAHKGRRDPLRCWLVQTVASSLWWPGSRSLSASHRATREADADRFAIERMGNDAPLLRALLRVDAVPVAAGLSSLTSERDRKLRELRQRPNGVAWRNRLALALGLALFVTLLVAAGTGLSDWQTFWLCPDGSSMSM